MRQFHFLGFALGSLLAALPVTAHHSVTGEFNLEQEVKVSGTLTKVEWMNPHIWFYVDVKNPDGSVVTWGFAGGAPGQLMRRGIMKSQLKLGSTVIVEGFRARDGSNNGFGRNVTYADGQRVFMAPPTETP